MPKTEKKAGTITTEEFNQLKEMVRRYGPELVVKKVAKVCTKQADSLAREYSSSALADALNEVADKIEATF